MSNTKKPDVIAFTLPYTQLLERDTSEDSTIGWGNGYVAVSKDNPFYGQCHGEYTFEDNTPGKISFVGLARLMIIHLPKHVPEDYWVFGFDTYCTKHAHYTKADVESVTNNLAAQLKQPKE